MFTALGLVQSAFICFVAYIAVPFIPGKVVHYHGEEWGVMLMFVAQFLILGWGLS